MLLTLRFYLVAFPWSAVCIFLGLVVMVFPGGSRGLNFIAQTIWAPVWLWAGGTRVQVEGALDHLDPAQPYVFVSNHQSYFDIPATMRAVPHQLRFVAKRELLLIPLFNLYIWRMGCPIVDRGNRESAKRTFEQAVDRIRSGVPILVYAEGTRTKTGQIGPFKKGAWILAIQSGVPIVPLTLAGSFEVWPSTSFWVRPGTIRVYVDHPIPTADLTMDDRHRLSEQVRNVIVSRYAQLTVDGHAEPQTDSADPSTADGRR